MGGRSATAFPPAAAWWADARGRLSAVSPRWEELTGRSAEKELGGAWLEGVHPEDRAGWLAAVREARDSTSELRHDLRLADAHGGHRWVRMHAVPQLDDSDRCVGFVGSACDVTDLKRVQEELFEELGRLARADRDLQELTHVALHDLQEPLRNLAHTLDQVGESPPRDDELLQRARGLTTSLQDLVKHLLEYAGMPRETPRAEPTEPLDSLEWAREHLAALIEQRGAQLQIESMPLVRADPVQLARVFQNLLANALLHSGDAALCIHISAEIDGDLVVFAVRDDGVGIPTEEHESIFGVLRRLHGPEIPGTGMGLAICRKLVERHGGRIWVESQPEHGATFRFTWPAA